MFSGSVRTTLLAALVFALPVDRWAGTDLKITDSRGTEVVVTGASIDYGGAFSADRETVGIRVLQGDGLVLLKWIDVATIKVTGKDSTAKPLRIELQIALRNGKQVDAALFLKGSMKLMGKTDLGDYSIDLDKVRSVAPIR